MKTLLVFAVLGLVIGGVREVYLGLRDRHMAVADIADLSGIKGKSWVKIDHCKVDLTRAVYSHSKRSDSPKEVYVPIVRPADSLTSPIEVVLKTKDPEIMKLVAPTSGNAPGISDNDVAVMKRYAKGMSGGDSVQGLVVGGIDDSSKVRTDVAKMMPGLSKDFLLIEDGREPSIGKGIAMLVGAAIFFGILMLMTKVSARSRVVSTGPPPFPPSVGSTGPPPLPPGTGS